MLDLSESCFFLYLCSFDVISLSEIGFPIGKCNISRLTTTSTDKGG